MFSKISSDQIIGVFLILGSGAVYFLLPKLIKVSNVSATPIYGPDFFPKVLLITLVLLSISLVIKSLINNRKVKVTDNESSVENNNPQKKAWVGWAVLGILVIYTFVVERFGFILTSIILMSIVLYLLSARKWYYYLILIGAIFLIHYVFVDLMRIMLP